MTNFEELLSQIRSCTACSGLPLGPKPLIQASPESQILIVGQAPGLQTHEKGIPWDDASGQRLRHWMQLPKDVFYNPKHVAIVPMGFCYPGRGTTGDLPPRKECAPLWHGRLLSELTNIKLTILVGQYAHKAFLDIRVKKTLTETVKAWREYHPEKFPLPHPSPLNNIWLSRNPWFEQKLIPALRRTIRKLELT